MLRLARDSDRDLVRTWRNHPDVRAVSLNQHVISAEEHAAWWGRVTVDPTRRVLVYELSGRPAGSVTFFDLQDEPAADGAVSRSAWWGFFLDVEGLGEGGQLLPAWIGVMRDATRYAVEELDLDVLHGEVLERNEAVRSLNRRFGIRETGSELREVGGSVERVLQLELSAADVRARVAHRTPGGAGQ